MSTRQRILAIRLMERMESHPDVLKALGVQVTTANAPQGDPPDQDNTSNGS